MIARDCGKKVSNLSTNNILQCLKVALMYFIVVVFPPRRIIINSKQQVEKFMELVGCLVEDEFWIPSETLVAMVDSSGSTVIGFGATGDVVALWSTSKNQIVALKSLDLLRTSAYAVVNELKIHLLARGCPNLLQIVGAQLIEDLSPRPARSLRLNIISEFAALGDLFSFLPLAQHVLKLYQLPEEFVFKLAVQLLKAVSQLHNLGLVHRVSCTDALAPTY